MPNRIEQMKTAKKKNYAITKAKKAAVKRFGFQCLHYIYVQVMLYAVPHVYCVCFVIKSRWLEPIDTYKYIHRGMT